MKELDYAREWKVLGAVLSRFNELERQLASIVSAYIAPDPSKSQFVLRQLLHNSTVSFAAKVRLVLAITKDVHGPKLNRDNFHRILNVRNALAHGIGPMSFRKNVNALNSAPYGEYLTVETLRGDGSVEERPTAQVTAEFIDLVAKLTAQLLQLNEKLSNDA